MNSKIVIAFVAGALIASGIVYIAVRRDLEPRPVPVAAKTAVPAAPASVAAPPVTPTAAVPATPAASPPAPTVAIPPAPALTASHVRETPAPKPAPVHREKPSPFFKQPARQESASNQTPPVSDEPIGEPAKPRTPAPPAEAAATDEAAPAAEPQTPPVPHEPAPARQPAPAPRPRVVLTPAPQDPETTPDPAAQPPRDPNAPPSVTIARGTLIPVRIGETISAAHYSAGDTFLATLDRPLVVDGWVIAERGSRLEGRVVQSTASGHGNDSRLAIELVKLSTADGQHVPIRTEAYSRDGSSSTGNDLAKVGIGTAIGAAIGAAAGGGKGAAIGAGIGAGAGVAGAVITRSKPAEIPVETRISFRVADPVTITEHAN